MTDSNTFKISLRVGFIVACIFGVAVTFNNCAVNPFYVERANQPVHKLQDDFVQAMVGQFSVNDCLNSSKFICTQKVFSTTISDSQSYVDFGCFDIEGGVTLCLNGNRYTYDSSRAAALCSGECLDSYDYEEVDCYYNHADVNGFYPLYASAGTLEEALGETFNLCMRVVNGK